MCDTRHLNRTVPGRALMSFLSRMFGRKNAEDGASAGSNSIAGRFGKFPIAGLSTTAGPSSIPTEMPPAKASNAQGTTMQAVDGTRPPTSAYFNRGDVIRGVFRVENVLAGGMGVVYICRQLSFDELPESRRAPHRPSTDTGVSPPASAHATVRYQVLKSFRRELFFHADVRSRFDREALLWVSLQPHPNIVRAQSFFNAEPCLMLEYVDGGDLRCRLGRPLDVQEVARIALQFCDGMIFLFESAGIVHRDIKPANILLTATGTVKITDFGLAKAFSSLPESTTGSQPNDHGGTDAGFATRFGSIVGSLPWMSPEQFTAPNEVTVVSDVYSFGVVLYEMLTGKLPYAASSGAEWMQKAIREIPVCLASGFGVDEELSAIVMKCLEKRPEHRHEDFVELRGALEGWAVRKGWSGAVPAPVSVSELESAMTAGDWMNRGYAFGQLGRNEDSYQSYLRALDVDPTWSGIHTNIGTALMRLGRFEEGLLHQQKQIEIEPKNALGWDTLAQAYLESNRLPEALDASRRASELAPEHIMLARHHAIIARRTGMQSEYEHAVAAVKALLNLAEYDKLGAVVNEAVQFLQSGDVRAGLEMHDLAVKKYPREALAWYNFGVTMHKAGQLEQAIRFYSRAIELDGKSTMAFVNRGLVRVRRSEYELARSDWQAAIVSDPKNQYTEMVQFLLQNNFVPYIKEHPQLKDFWETINSPSMLRYVI
jgi:serine/threonine protein kinase